MTLMTSTAAQSAEPLYGREIACSQKYSNFSWGNLDESIRNRRHHENILITRKKIYRLQGWSDFDDFSEKSILAGDAKSKKSYSDILPHRRNNSYDGDEYHETISYNKKRKTVYFEHSFIVKNYQKAYHGVHPGTFQSDVDRSKIKEGKRYLLAQTEGFRLNSDNEFSTSCAHRVYEMSSGKPTLIHMHRNCQRYNGHKWKAHRICKLVK